MKLTKLTYALVIMILLSCNDEPVVKISGDNLLGYWEVVDAYRNKRKTKLLNNAFIEITDSTFFTNIPPLFSRLKYSYHNNQLSLINEQKSKFEIISLHNDTLSLSTELKSFKFKLILSRKSNPHEN